MILFQTETSFQLKEKRKFKRWIFLIAKNYSYVIGDINFIFCSDEQLFETNKKYLNHDTYTDIITFDYSEGVVISGDIFISIDRVKENAEEYEVTFQNELLRVLAHGILHLCGFKDKTPNEKQMMREQESLAIEMFEKVGSNC